MSKSSFHTITKVLLFALTTGTKLVLRFKYRKAAVFWLPPGVLPYYLLWALSFSSSPLGSVSVGSWLFVVDSAVSMIIGIFTNVKTILATQAGPAPVPMGSPPAGEKVESVPI